jgi:hypothetical protein
MVIKASAAAEIRTLVEALVRQGPSDDVQREAAVARLAIIGGRAVDRLIDAYEKTTDRQARIAILRTLEAIGDERGRTAALDAIAEGGDVGVAATAVLRTFLSSPHDGVAAGALDALVAAALDRTRDRRLRLAALEALQDMPEAVRERVSAAVERDPDKAIRDVVRSVDADAARSEAVWNDAVEGRLEDDPRALRQVLDARAATAPLNTLRRLIDAVRAKEASGDSGWVGVRGALHQTLALRGSRVALYDLRETLERGAAPLPVSFLAALHVLGDESCLEPLATAWNRALGDERWRHQLSAAFRAIARREKITQRHAVMKRIATRSPELVRQKPDTVVRLKPDTTTTG